MTDKVREALSHLSDSDAEIIREKNSDEYILHYYKKAKAHEEKGKIKGEFGTYFNKMLLKDKSRFYEKGERNKELALKEAEKKRKAQLKTQRMLDELKDREKMSSDEIKRAKELFRKLPELEQQRRIKREQKKNPDKSFHQNRDAAVLTFNSGG